MRWRAAASSPRSKYLEDHLDRPTSYSKDPIDELLASGEVTEEATGMFTFGPLMSRLINYLEGRFPGTGRFF